MESIDQCLARMKKEQSITCPHCDKLLSDDFEFMEDLITYHAEDGAVEKECGWCLKTFWVKEAVRRTWEEFKTEKEAYD